MELVIHGTKGGYKILYSTPNIPQTVARDVRPDTSSEKAVGQSAYSLSLITEGRIYTKYAIIRDMLRGMYTGNIAFSLFLPNNENLAGAKIKSLLDEISGWYSKYIPDHNLKNVHEDWSVIDGILNKYKSLLVHKEIEPLQAGAKDAVFVYYSSDEELHKYFDSAHCQEEYTEYKQVFFVSKNMENKPQNPIYALRHSENVPIKIDLENIFYKLNGFNGTGDNGIVIEIRNGKGQLLHDKDKIYKKDFISLRYSKKYFKEINLRGRPDDESIKKYLIIDEGNKKITLKKNIELEAERKTVLFFAQDNKGNLVSNVEISCRTNYLPEKIAINNEITFSGEEIGQAWQVSTKGITENMLFYKIIITPENRNEPVRITLIKRKVVKVIAIDKETHYYICDFSIRTKGYWENKPELTFENDEIDEFWNIEVSTKDGYYGKIENYCPATGENPLYLELEPQPKESKTKKTNSFVKRHPKLIVFIITVLIFAIVGAWLWNSSLKTEKQKQAFIKQIKEYVEGEELLPDKLKKYNKQWGERDHKIETKGGSWLSIIGLGKKGKPDSTKYKKWNETQQKIEDAMRLRELIRELNFAELKKQNYYSPKQNVFKETVTSYLDSALYQQVGDCLIKLIKEEDLDKMDLNAIAAKINPIVDSIKNSQITETTGKQKGKEDDKKSKKEIKHSLQGNLSTQSPNTDKTNEIRQYLRGGELKKDSLEKYKKDANTSLKTSIDLCLEFWELDGSLTKTYYEFRNKINQDVNLKDSDLMKFLDEMCKTEQPKYLKEIRSWKNIKTLNKLKEKVK